MIPRYMRYRDILRETKRNLFFSSWMRFTVKRILLTVKRHISRCQSGSRIIRAYRQQRMVERCQPISPYFLSVCSCRSRWIPHISHMPRVGLHLWRGAHEQEKSSASLRMLRIFCCRDFLFLFNIGESNLNRIAAAKAALPRPLLSRFCI